MADATMIRSATPGGLKRGMPYGGVAVQFDKVMRRLE